MATSIELFKKNPNTENSRAFQNLRRAMENGRVLAFVGAGVSRRFKFPTWEELMHKLHDEAVRQEHFAAATRYLRDQDDYLWRAQYYKELLRSRFDRTLQKAFLKRFQPDDFLRTLINLPFRHFLTTNYDNVLSRSHRRFRKGKPRVIEWTDERRVREFINALNDDDLGTRTYVHLHGRITARRVSDDLILTDSQYADRYLRSEDARRKLFTIFATQRVAFIGFSMSDPDLKSLIRLVHASIGSTRTRHFAIIGVSDKDGHPNLIRKQWREKYGIEPVLYPNMGEHKLLVKVVNSLRTGAPIPKLHVKTTRVEIKKPKVPTDPQKGQWGGKSRNRGREVVAAFRHKEAGYYKVRITLRATNGEPLVEPIRFHLHDTFEQESYPQDAYLDKKCMGAYIDITTYGAFTVGVEENNGQTRLELDLANMKGAPKDFLEN